MTTTKDDATGFDSAPARYTKHERETIDRMRDMAGALYEEAFQARCSVNDAVFAVHCALTALKYEDREGLKGDAAEDAKKARFYRAMHAHVLNRGEDPRSSRPGFKAYKRPKK